MNYKSKSYEIRRNFMQQTAQAKRNYQHLVEQISPNSHTIRDCIRAFVSGGIICTIGEIIITVLESMNFNQEQSAMINTVILIFVGSLLTGLDIYDKLGKFSGAGTIVPITGFANSIVSPAIEYKKEGYIFGVGAKMFTIAGPVIVYATLCSVAIGFIYYIIKIFFG